MTNIQRFTVYRRNLSDRGTHTEVQRNPDDAPQYEGVIWSDGSVTLRWLTACASTSVWKDIETMLMVHGHPEYGTDIMWHDGPAPEIWIHLLQGYKEKVEEANKYRIANG